MNNDVFFLGFTVGIIVSILIWLALKLRIKKLNQDVLTQFYLSDISDFWEGEPRKVKNLPDFIERYFLYITEDHGFISKSEFTTKDDDIRQQIEGKFNLHVLVGGVRISTFFTFTDGENILVYDRRKPTASQGIINSKKDCYGAVAFNNLSLLAKLPKEFWDEDIMSVNLIPGVAFEYMKGGNTAIMIGITILVDKKSLQKAENDFNVIYKSEDIDKQANEMTSKLRLTISQR